MVMKAEIRSSTVMTPTSLSPSNTGMPPILCSWISRAASSTLVSGVTLRGGLDHDVAHGDHLQHGGQEHFPQSPGR